MFDEEHVQEDRTNLEARRMFTQRPNLRLLAEDPDPEWPIWRGAKRIFGFVSSAAGRSATFRFFRDGGIGADRMNPHDANAIHIRKLQDDVNALRQESWWQFAELSNRLTDLLKLSTASARQAPSGTGRQPAGPLQQEAAVPLRYGSHLKGLRQHPSIPPSAAQATANDISVAMGLPSPTPRNSRETARRRSSASASASARSPQPIRRRYTRSPPAPMPPLFGSDGISPTRSPVGSPLPTILSIESRAPSVKSRAPSVESFAPSLKDSPAEPEPPSPQFQASPAPHRSPTPAIPQETEPLPTHQNPTSAQPQRASASGPAIPKNAKAGKQPRSPVVNIKNHLIRRVVDEKWVVNRDAVTRSLRTPSQVDVQAYMASWQNIPRQVLNTVLPPIPDHLKPDDIRFNRARHREEGKTDPCAIWDLAMTTKLVDVYLLPRLHDSIVEVEDWTSKEKQSQERDNLIKSLLRRVYSLHETCDKGEDDIQARNKAQRVVSGRDRLYNKRSDIAEADPKFKHMLAMLRHIGQEGMSSDEEDSNHEGSNRRIVHEHPWRHPNVTLALRALDNRNEALGGRLVKKSNRGNKPFIRIVPPPGKGRPSNRIKDDLIAFAAAVPRRLPGNFYNLRRLRIWIDSFSDEDKEMMTSLTDFLDAQKDNVACLAVPSLVNPE
ncbi:hypothetical protein CYLTODRAFT_458913 [Cylindrobasidium torrendii FP15055 ss-10]|uniref:Uncharacterized protein n=1 Tax=Cylindrobasidium torrendii FP15055 ss-10 TaxID=1314674 RepID=A0A0D7AZ14_9AGAR|nr:hypothetical protein CYLTODRAFT_458913 [Cylindrobasidium torrendii FP15055 ss-10]